MRKVTSKTVKAFLNGTTASVSNTVSSGDELLLHGNVIAKRHACGKIEATLAGWPTPTTKERLNGLCELLGIGRPFHQKRGEQFYGSQPIESNDWIVVKPSDQPSQLENSEAA